MGVHARQLRSAGKMKEPFVPRVAKKNIGGRLQSLTSPVAVDFGQDVIEYTGKLLSGDDAKRKLEESRNTPKQLMYMFFFTYKGVFYCIDATMNRGISKSLISRRTENYNLVPRIFFDESDIQKTNPRVMFVASKFIYPGDTLVIYYGLLRIINKLCNIKYSFVVWFG